MNRTLNKTLLALTLVLFASAPVAFADESQTDAGSQTPVAGKIRYKAGKDVDFEELLIQGRIKRPEISIVTGDSGFGTDGLLKLRENFVDRMSVDMAEEVK